MPKPVTLIVPYYENQQFFGRQCFHWWNLFGSYPGHFRLIVVDDGSPTYQLCEITSDPPGLARVFRIETDVPWNWLAARNIGAKEAQDGWLLMTDIDHVVSIETLESVMYGVHRTDTIYGFSRIEHTGEVIEPHKNSWLLTKEMFWKVGGYDETLSGHYGTDGDWRLRCAQTAEMAILADRLVRHEFVGDSSTTRYQRKLPEDTQAVKRLIAQRGPGWKPKTLSFPYHEVTAAQEVA